MIDKVKIERNMLRAIMLAMPFCVGILAFLNHYFITKFSPIPYGTSIPSIKTSFLIAFPYGFGLTIYAELLSICFVVLYYFIRYWVIPKWVKKN